MVSREFPELATIVTSIKFSPARVMVSCKLTIGESDVLQVADTRSVWLHSHNVIQPYPGLDELLPAAIVYLSLSCLLDVRAFHTCVP